MRLLVTTQVVNKNDTNLGFFHEWLKRLAANVDKLYVVCLYKGDYDLPANVEVISLGKEQGRVSALKYSWRFYGALLKLRGQYDGVFVHMNPEYLILAGAYWRITGKKVLFWYTHKAVNLRLRIAVFFATKIFTASKESFRLKSKKVEVVGHGIPVESFNTQSNLSANSLNIVSAGRNAASKNHELINNAISLVRQHLKPVPVSLDVVSDISYKDMPAIYSAHHLLTHASITGSMDKVVLEALAAGRIVVTSSEAYKHLDGSGFVFWFPPGNYQELAKTIENIWHSGILKALPNQKAIEYVRQNHNLDALIKRIVGYYSVK